MLKKQDYLLVLVSFFAIIVFGLSTTAFAQKKALTIATAGMSGNWYPFGGGISKIINDNFPDKYTATVVTSTGTQENVRRIDKGQVPFALGSARQCYEAYKGVPPLFKKPLRISGIAAHYGAFYALLTNAKRGIKTIADIKKNKAKISTYLPGHEIADIAENYVLEANGIKIEDFDLVQYDFSEALANFKDGHIDGFFAPVSLGMASVTELTRTKKVNWVEFGDAAFDKISKSSFGQLYPVITVPANSFPHQSDYKTIGYQYQIIADPSLSEELVYDITKALWENMDQIYAINPGFKAGTLENACRNLVIPPHPGALRYYKEKGVDLGPWK
jgi:TRAP transporter TAXI family solute receptor